MNRTRHLAPLLVVCTVVLVMGLTACGSSSSDAPANEAQEPIAGPWGQLVGATIPATLVEEHASELEPAPEGPGQLRVVGTAFRLVPLEDGTFVIARDGLDRPSNDN